MPAAVGEGLSCTAHAQVTVSRAKPVRFITKTQAPVACTLWILWNVITAMIQLPDSWTQKGFPRLGSPSSGSFNKWQGRFCQHFVIILKRKLLEIGKIDSFGMLLKEECGAHYAATAEVHFTVHSEMHCAGCKHPRYTLGPHLFKLTAASTRR